MVRLIRVMAVPAFVLAFIVLAFIMIRVMAVLAFFMAVLVFSWLLSGFYYA